MARRIPITSILENHEIRIKEQTSAIEALSTTMEDVVTRFNTLINSKVVERVNELIETSNSLEKGVQSLEARMSSMNDDDMLEETTTQITELREEMSKFTSDLNKMRTMNKSSNSLVRSLKKKVDELENLANGETPANDEE
jgi:predicted RNase H-like nuclease (RuvC/YqgF family)